VSKKYKHIAVSDRTHALAKGLAKVWGINIDDAVTAGLITLDKQKGGDSHSVLADRVTEIRARMSEAKEREASKNRAAASCRARARGRSPRFDHSVWKWETLEKLGDYLFIPDGLHHGAYCAAARYRGKHLDKWEFSMKKVPGGYNFVRVAPRPWW
jgi:hypothetical protein